MSLTLVLISLSGCVRVFDNDDYNYQTIDQRLDEVALKNLFDAISLDFCKSSCSDCASPCTEIIKNSEPIRLSDGTLIQPPYEQETVIVTDFVDLQSFEPEGAGLLMAELMRGSLHNVCCNRVVQGEFSKYFKLTDKGLVVLSRSSKDIKKDEYPGRYIVVGTYEYGSNKLMIFVKKINISTGKIDRMVTRELDFMRDYSGKVTYEVR
ncbi:MAG: FlgO family outer membrane protein [Deltaproteobacteria bacterium]|nr:FlgO family outer membrane protein [Deltaproteobacteria bacterium]